MSVFKTDEGNENSLDWKILRDGGIALYRNQDFLSEDTNWLRSNGYKVVTFDCADWLSSRDMHESLKHALSFPSYYGHNLDALDECMQEDIQVPDSGGLVLVLEHYDQYSRGPGSTHTSQRCEAEVVLDIFALAGRHHLLFGRRLITIVQSDDPGIQFERLGCVSARWNSREWLNKSRGM